MTQPGMTPRRTRSPIRSAQTIGLPRGIRQRQIIVLKPRHPQEEPLWGASQLYLDQLDNGRFALGLVQPEVAGLRQADWAYLSHDELWALADTIDELVLGHAEAWRASKPKLVVIVHEGLVEEVRATISKEAIDIEIVDLDGFDIRDEATDSDQSKEAERHRCEREYPHVLY